MEPITSRISRLNLLYQVKSVWPGIKRLVGFISAYSQQHCYTVLLVYYHTVLLVCVNTQSVPSWFGGGGAKEGNDF